MHSASARAARIPRESSENRIHCCECIAMNLFNSHKRRTCSIHTYLQRNKRNEHIQLPQELNTRASLPHTQHTVWVAWIRRYQSFFLEKLNAHAPHTCTNHINHVCPQVLKQRHALPEMICRLVPTRTQTNGSWRQRWWCHALQAPSYAGFTLDAQAEQRQRRSCVYKAEPWLVCCKCRRGLFFEWRFSGVLRQLSLMCFDLWYGLYCAVMWSCSPLSHTHMHLTYCILCSLHDKSNLNVKIYTAVQKFGISIYFIFLERK